MKTLIKLEDNPEVFIVNNIYEFLNPECVYIPLNNLKIKDKTYLYKDTFLNNHFISVSGYATLGPEMLIDKKLVSTLKIVNDFKENKDYRPVKIKLKSTDDLIKALDDSHLKIIKDKITSIGPINSLIVSCFDEEIYEMNEFMCLVENYKEILKLTDDLKKLFGLDKVIFAIKSTNVKGIKKVKSISGVYPDLQVMLIPDKYLMSYPDNLRDYLNVSREGNLILTTNEVYQITEILKGKKISEAYITISGDALKKSLIIKTKVGVALREVINNFIKIVASDYNVFLNGFWQGYQVSSLDNVVITEHIHSVVINKKPKEEETECINCGACEKICPVNINVKKCYQSNLRSRKCIGCGLCEYICPANLKLKEIVRGDYCEDAEN